MGSSVSKSPMIKLLKIKIVYINTLQKPFLKSHFDKWKQSRCFINIDETYDSGLNSLISLIAMAVCGFTSSSFELLFSSYVPHGLLPCIQAVWIEKWFNTKLESLNKIMAHTMNKKVFMRCFVKILPCQQHYTGHNNHFHVIKIYCPAFYILYFFTRRKKGVCKKKKVAWDAF